VFVSPQTQKLEKNQHKVGITDKYSCLFDVVLRAREEI
jgi:hypothetical protein